MTFSLPPPPPQLVAVAAAVVLLGAALPVWGSTCENPGGAIVHRKDNTTCVHLNSNDIFSIGTMHMGALASSTVFRTAGFEPGCADSTPDAPRPFGSLTNATSSHRLVQMYATLGTECFVGVVVGFVIGSELARALL
jgi:hypothetical protein